MSISDTLSEAIETIREYQRDQEWMYGEFKPDIDAVVEQMEALRLKLDTPPKPARRKVPILPKPKDNKHHLGKRTKTKS